jgi:hypothetical protein
MQYKLLASSKYLFYYRMTLYKKEIVYFFKTTYLP